MTASAMREALLPLAQGLLSAANADAKGVIGAAAAASARRLAAARQEADAILAEAQRQGEADATAVQAAGRAAARRAAREKSLRVQREIYDELRRRCRSDLSARTAQSLRPGLAAAARRILGDDAAIHDADGGGVIAVAAGRRLDLSMEYFVEQAAAELGWQLLEEIVAAASGSAAQHGGAP